MVSAQVSGEDIGEKIAIESTRRKLEGIEAFEKTGGGGEAAYRSKR